MHDLDSQVLSIRDEMKLDEIKHFIEQSQNTEDESLLMISLEKATNLLQIRKKLHEVLCVHFSTRFPDLSVLIRDFTKFSIIAKYLAVNDVLDDDDIKSLLSDQEKSSIALTSSQNMGPQITNESFFVGCDLQINSHEISSELLKIASARVTTKAPNLVKFVGSAIATSLIYYAGGLYELSNMPSCNIKYLGVNKADLHGMSSSSTQNHLGVIYTHELVQQNPEFRDKIYRELVNKVALCARCDFQSDRSGDYGEKYKFEIETKIDKWRNNKTPRYVKPLDPPGSKRKVNRGGRQARAYKKKFGMSKEQKARLKVLMGVDGQFAENGTQYGVTAFRRIKRESSRDAPFQEKIAKKLSSLNAKILRNRR